VLSEVGEPTPERGGRAKRYFRITDNGLRQVRDTRAALVKLWKGIPALQGGTRWKASYPPILATKLLGQLVSGRTVMLLPVTSLNSIGKDARRPGFWRQALLAIIVSFAKDRTLRRTRSPWIVARASAHDRKRWPSSFESRKRIVYHGSRVVVGLRCLFDLGWRQRRPGEREALAAGAQTGSYWASFSSQAI